MSKTFILDNGSYSIKAGFSTDFEPKMIPNYILKSTTEQYIGGDIVNCSDPAGFYRLSPFEKGYPVHMNIESKIWQQLFGQKDMDVNCSDTKLVLTDPNFTVPALDIFSRELLFETYGFHSLLITSAPTLIGRRNYVETGNDFSLVIDAGHSFTHVVPFLAGRNHVGATTRIEVGGMVITNFLRRQLTNQVDLMNDFGIVNEIKEDCCYVAENYSEEFLKYENMTKRLVTYYLPDYATLFRGKIKSDDDSPSLTEMSKVLLGAGRAVAPEALFQPSFVGIQQLGLSGAIKKVCSEKLPYHCVGENLMKNVICIGGTSKFEGFKNRLCHDLENAFDVDEKPAKMKNCVHISNNPIAEPWKAASYLLKNDHEFSSCFVSKQEFSEHGVKIFDQKYKLSVPLSWYDKLTNKEN